MKKLIAGFMLLALLCISVHAQVYVGGYTRSDGRYVQGHYRSNPDGNFYNNWSTKPNINPYTGSVGTRVTPPHSYGTYDYSYGGSRRYRY